MKKRFVALMLLLCMTIGVLPANATDVAAAEKIKMNFTDVDENHPAYSAILYLFENEIINGKTETLFYPDDFLRREEFAKILSKSLASSPAPDAPIYYDVADDAWYTDYVRSTVVSVLMNGVSENTFGVGLTLSRQDLAVVLNRYLSYTRKNIKVEANILYADSNEVSDYARESVELISSSGIMPARANNMWCPNENVTRAEAVQALYNSIVIHKEQQKSLGRDGDIVQYSLPHETITDDKLAEIMPTPFDAKTWPQQEIAVLDFETDDYGILKKDDRWTSNAVHVREGGYNSNGCIRIDGKGDAFLTWTTKPGEVNPGDYIALTAMVKGENIDSSAGGYFCDILEVSNEQGKWLNEAHADGQKKSTDWKELQQILMIPEGVNQLTQPEYYNISVRLYVGNIEGTVYFDDVRLFKIKFAPMDTVLMEPVYKGIIKGEDGIGDISLRAYINELNGLYDLDRMNFTAQVVDEDDKVYMKSESQVVTTEMDVHFSSADLPMNGDFWLESILSDKETGEVIQKQEWGLHKREADFQTVIGIDEYGRITRNGEPYFPISVYNWENVTDNDIIAEADFVDNIQRSEHGWYYQFGNDESHRERNEMLIDKEKTVSLATGNLAFSNIYHANVSNRVKEQKDIRGLVTKLANNYKDLPNLFAYYIYDEQNGTRYGEEQAWVRKIIESIDLDHPTTCAIDNPISFRKGIYAKTSDFLGYDPYPATGKESQDLSLVYDRISEAKRINPNRPVYAILQMFWYKGRGDLRGPTQEEFRNMAFQAILAGSCMLDAYAFSEAYHSPSPGREKGEEWKEWGKVFEEIQRFEPIILSVEPAPYYEVKGEVEWLNTMARRHDGKSYLFAVNNSGTANTASIHLDGIKEIKGMYSEKVYKADENGCFEISFDAYQTEVFEWVSEDYKSPHAELTHFGLSEALIIDAESDAPSFIIPSDMTDAEYSFKMSDFAQAYINGKKVETKGKINLDGLSELDVKVASEDGRFVAEKTYQIKRS